MLAASTKGIGKTALNERPTNVKKPDRSQMRAVGLFIAFGAGGRDYRMLTRI